MFTKHFSVLYQALQEMNDFLKSNAVSIRPRSLDIGENTPYKSSYQSPKKPTAHTTLLFTKLDFKIGMALATLFKTIKHDLPNWNIKLHISHTGALFIYLDDFKAFQQEGETLIANAKSYQTFLTLFANKDNTDPQWVFLFKDEKDVHSRNILAAKDLEELLARIRYARPQKTPPQFVGRLTPTSLGFTPAQEFLPARKALETFQQILDRFTWPWPVDAETVVSVETMASLTSQSFTQNTLMTPDDTHLAQESWTLISQALLDLANIMAIGGPRERMEINLSTQNRHHLTVWVGNTHISGIDDFLDNLHDLFTGNVKTWLASYDKHDWKLFQAGAPERLLTLEKKKDAPLTLYQVDITPTFTIQAAW